MWLSPRAKPIFRKISFYRMCFLGKILNVDTLKTRPTLWNITDKSNSHYRRYQSHFRFGIYVRFCLFFFLSSLSPLRFYREKKSYHTSRICLSKLCIAIWRDTRTEITFFYYVYMFFSVTDMFNRNGCAFGSLSMCYVVLIALIHLLVAIR